MVCHHRNPSKPLPPLSNEIALMTLEEFIKSQNPNEKFHPSDAYDFDLDTLNKNSAMHYVDTLRLRGGGEFLIFKAGNDFQIEYRGSGSEPRQIAAIIHDSILYYANPHLFKQLPTGYMQNSGRGQLSGPWVQFDVKQTKRVKYLKEVLPLIDRVKERNLRRYPNLYQEVVIADENYQIRSETALIPNRGVTMVVLNQLGQVVAQASDEWGATLLAVAREYRGKGLGKVLGKIWMQWNPEYESGGFTQAGLASYEAIWRERVREFLENQWYSRLIKAGQMTVSRLREITRNLKPRRKTEIPVKGKEKNILILVQKDVDMWGPAFIIYDRAFLEKEDEDEDDDRYIYGFGFFRDSTPGTFLYTIDYDRPFAKLATYVAMQIARNNHEDVYVGEGYGDMLELDGLEHIEIDGDYASLTEDVINLEDFRQQELLTRRRYDQYDQKYHRLMEIAHAKWD